MTRVIGLPLGKVIVALIPISVCLVSLVSSAPRMEQWYGSWGETGASLEDATVLTYPLIAGFAAWFSGNPRRRHFSHLLSTSTRTLFRVHIHAALVIGFLGAVGSILGASIILVTTAQEATFGHFQPTVLLVIACGCWTSAAFGVCLGAILPPRIAPPITVAAVYAVSVFLDPTNPSLIFLAGLAVADSRERTFLAVADWVLVTRALWLTTVGFALVALVSKNKPAWFTSLGISSLMAVPLLLLGQHAMQPNPAARRVACTDFGAELSVCLSAARSHAAGEVHEAITKEVDLLAGLAPHGITLVEEDVLSETASDGTSRRLVVPIGLVNGSDGNAHVPNPVDLQLQVAMRVLSDNCAADNSPGTVKDLADAGAEDVLLAWLLTELDIPIDGTASLGSPILSEDALDYSGEVGQFRHEWFAAAFDRKHAWLRVHRDEILSCELSPGSLDL